MECVSQNRVNQVGVTLDIQLEAIQGYASLNDIQLIEGLRYVDEGKSAYTNRIDKRPDFQRLLTDARWMYAISRRPYDRCREVLTDP